MEGNEDNADLGRFFDVPEMEAGSKDSTNGCGPTVSREKVLDFRRRQISEEDEDQQAEVIHPHYLTGTGTSTLCLRH